MTPLVAGNVPIARRTFGDPCRRPSQPRASRDSAWPKFVIPASAATAGIQPRTQPLNAPLDSRSALRLAGMTKWACRREGTYQPRVKPSATRVAGHQVVETPIVCSLGFTRVSVTNNRRSGAREPPDRCKLRGSRASLSRWIPLDRSSSPWHRAHGFEPCRRRATPRFVPFGHRSSRHPSLNRGVHRITQPGRAGIEPIGVNARAERAWGCGAARD